jgi:hypothetical protein
MRPQYAASDPVGSSIAIGGILIMVAVLLIPIAIVIAVVRYFRELSEERRRLRLEVGKLAHELESLRSDLTERTESARETSA